MLVSVIRFEAAKLVEFADTRCRQSMAQASEDLTPSVTHGREPIRCATVQFSGAIQ